MNVWTVRRTFCSTCYSRKVHVSIAPARGVFQRTRESRTAFAHTRGVGDVQAIDNNRALKSTVNPVFIGVFWRYVSSGTTEMDNGTFVCVLRITLKKQAPTLMLSPINDNCTGIDAVSCLRWRLAARKIRLLLSSTAPILPRSIGYWQVLFASIPDAFVDLHR